VPKAQRNRRKFDAAFTAAAVDHFIISIGRRHISHNLSILVFVEVKIEYFNRQM
jgi:hypothetical protein